MVRHGRSFATRLGLDVRPWPSRQGIDFTRSRILRSDGWRTVLDVGANRGQWAVMCRRLGYRGRIISFEPLPEPLVGLRRRAFRDGQWDVVPVALGLTLERGVAMYVSSNAQMSSSLLPMLERHEVLAPASSICASALVDVEPLDSIWDSLNIEPGTYLKIDVQGTELDVLRGGIDHLEAVSAVEVETSIEPLYEGGAAHDSVSELLRGLGFSLVGIQMGLVDLEPGSAASVDSIWRRQGASFGTTVT